MSDLLLPRYGHSTLADLLPAIGAHLGVPGCLDEPLGLPAARRWVVVLVDGLGHHLLQGALRHTEYFSEVFGDAQVLTSGVPSTTATSLASLGTGLVPGQHGMAGYSFRAPAGGVMNALTWEGGPGDPAAFQPRETLFERAAAAGVAVSSVGPARFEASAMTLASLRGTEFLPADERDDAARVRLAVDASRRGARSLVYVYDRSLDHVGHARGVASAQWLTTLERIDRFCSLLRARLDDETCLLVTGDHGMIDVPVEHQVIVEDHPGLLEQVGLLAGEARMRQLWTRSPAPVAARWQQVLGERALVLTREQAVEQGWFGELDARVATRFGDVLVAMRADWALMTRAHPRELALVGQHGSLTPQEMMVPLLVDHPESY